VEPLVMFYCPLRKVIKRSIVIPGNPGAGPGATRNPGIKNFWIPAVAGMS
jgi:hypothetical protein